MEYDDIIQDEFENFLDSELTEDYINEYLDELEELEQE